MKWKQEKRWLSLVLAVSMLLSCVPFGSFAEETETAASEIAEETGLPTEETTLPAQEAEETTLPAEETEETAEPTHKNEPTYSRATQEQMCKPCCCTICKPCCS